MLTLTELGNIFARCGYNLPTIDIEHVQFEFTSFLALVSFLCEVGEQGSLRETKPGLRTIDSLVAAAALYETLFNKRTIGQRDESTASILVDTLKDQRLFDPTTDLDLSSLKASNPYLARKFKEVESIDPVQLNKLLDRSNNIISTFDVVHLIGWRYHESQQQAKSRGSAQFSLKDVVTEINEKEEVDEATGEVRKVKYGVIVDDGENIIEEDKIE